MRLGSSRPPIVLGPWRCTAARIEQSTLGRGAVDGNPARVFKMLVGMFLLPVLTRAHMERRFVPAWAVLSKSWTTFVAASAPSLME